VVKVRRDDLHVLTGSYVLDAVSQAEQAGFEHHLQHCPACEAEVRGLRETAARLAMACAVTAPARMEQRVLAATYHLRQLPPVSGNPLSRLRAARDRRRARPEQALAREHRRARAEQVSARDRRRVPAAPGRWPRRLAIAAAAASVATAAGLGITELSAQHQLDSARSSAAAIARVVTAPDARVETERTRAGGRVTVVTSAALHEAVVSATGLPPLSSGRVYQAWVMTPSGARSAGLVTAVSLLASGVRPGDRIGITVEPPGGAKRPTTTPVAVLPV
jgi:anti-sigma-K factor RskA